MSESQRMATLERNTRETRIAASLNLDGSGRTEISTGIPFLNHMLELFGRHALVDLKLEATGDLDVDYHHTVEDVGLVLGTLLDQALGERRGIMRYGHCLLPMDESLAEIALDLGGRPYLVYRIANRKRRILEFDVGLIEEFFRAFVVQSRMNLHIAHRYGDDPHHAYESVFKGVARALRSAMTRDPREAGVPSSKGVL